MDLHPANQPVFPSRDYSGLSRREYFALHIASQIIGREIDLQRILMEAKGDNSLENRIVRASIKIADNLVTQLDATRPNDKEPKPCEKCGKDINAGKCECLPF